MFRVNSSEIEMSFPLDGNMSSPPLTYADTRRELIRRILVEVYNILESNIAALMATEDPVADTEPKRADWTPEEVTALVHYLHEHRSERGDTGNFRQSTYVNVAEHIRPLHVSGKIKDQKNVSIKWGALKQTYNAIVTYRSKSGEHWDNECGANISGALAAENWAKYIAVKANTHMKPFRNKGWEYLEYMEDIFPQGGATGAHAFRAGASNIPAANTDGSNASGTTPIPPPSVSDSIPVSVGSLAMDSDPITSDPPTSDPLTSTSGGKRSFNMMSTDVTDTDPSSLFSNQCPPATQVTSAPKSKRSRTSSSKAKAQGNSHTVAVVSVDNSIRRLGDQLSTTFMDPLVAVQMATQALYRQSEIPSHHRAYMVRQFSAISNTAAVFISLPDDEARRDYAADMYTNSRFATGSGGAEDHFAL